jgi:hypothetical protein
MPNPFEAMAERQMSAPAKRQVARTEERAERERISMVPTPLEKKLQDSAAQLKMYRKWRKGVRSDIVAGHRDWFAGLLRLLRKMSWLDVELVVKYVSDAKWLRKADETTRWETLRFIDDAIGRSRVRQGLPEMDDGLPDEPLTPFIKIRRLLMRF